MRRTRFNWRVARLLGFAMIVFAIAASSFGQGTSGNIFGKVVDADGSVIPGATVTLSGGGATQVFITDADGQFRFLNLAPGQYTLTAELAGFGSVVRSGVQVNIGRNSNITLPLTPALEQTITVTAETPLLDVRKTGTGATITEVELEEVPSARDPWVILQQVPGVLMDRINVGGNESGQQSQFVSKGTDSFQAIYNVDGVNTTDMIATGGSSSYYDFAAFEEIQVTTGGTDPRIQTPGAQINMVTKRGTNEFSGSGRYYLTDGEWQADPSVPAEAQSYLGLPNEIDEITEWGFEIGGPIIRDRLWAWAAYADNQIDLFVAQPPGQVDRYFDNTVLETLNAKLNAQLTANNSATGFYYNNSKEKAGRNASPVRPPETTWNQAGFGPEGTYKIEDTHIFSPNFYLTGLYSKVNGGFGLWPRGSNDCADMDCVYANSPKATTLDLLTGEWRNSFLGVQGERPQEQVRADGSTFFDTGGLNHELRFGFGYRTADATGLTVWPNDQLILDFTSFADAFDDPFYEGFGITYFFAIGPYDYGYEYLDAYVGDTILLGDLTLQIGARWDQQEAASPNQTGPLNPLLPDYLPALSIAGNEIDTMEWSTISPRVGATYAVGEENRLLLRGSYARYVDQMGSNSTGYTGAIPVWYRSIAFYTRDLNGNDLIDNRDEILFDYGVYTWFGFDLDDPGAVFNPFRVDQGVDAPTTDEFIAGFEYEVMPEFVVGLNYTHRNMKDFIAIRNEKTPGSGNYFTADDYELTGYVTPEGDARIDPITGETLVDAYNIPFYSVKESVLNEFGRPGSYRVLTNRPDYEQNYDGVELTLVKRMSNRWMARANATFSDWTQDVGRLAFEDPSPVRGGSGCVGGPEFCDGADVVSGSGTISGAKGAVWVNSEWAYSITGVYQIPVIETSLGVNINGRQGYPVIYTATSAAGPDFDRDAVLVDGVTSNRLDDIFQIDLRLSKEFMFGGAGFQVAVDAFNITDEQTVMQRDADLTNSRGVRDGRNRIRELQSPQIFRVGVRLNF